MKKTAIGALIICIMALVSAGCGSEQAVTFGTIGTETENVSQAEQANEGGKPTSALDDTRGVWIASVSNIDFPSKPGLSADELRAQLDGIVETVCNRGLNTIFFQVRPASDALYRSEIFPVSAYLTGMTPEDIQKERDEVLFADQDSIRALADLIEAVLKEDALCVIGNEEKLKAQAGMFAELKELY